MVRKTQPADAKTQPPAKAAKPDPEAESGELKERIERLEQRFDESILGDDGLAAVEQGVDRNPSGDSRQRVVRRSNVKRDSRKA